MALKSMTGFASLGGDSNGQAWQWEVRSVNGRGLELRLRLPDGAERLDPVLRKAVAQTAKRGNIAVNLKPSRTSGGGQTINPDGLQAALAAAQRVTLLAEGQGIVLAPMTAAQVLQMEGVLQSDATGDWVSAAEKQISELLKAFDAARAQEGAAIGAILKAQLGSIATLVAQATDAANERGQKAADLIRARVLALMEATELADESRLSQELAQIAVKADVTEELDRLGAHVDAARDLLNAKGPIGRKFDFLTQEFNREANTLCSKSGSTALTAIGLELKVIIDQMREQVQNLE